MRNTDRDNKTVAITLRFWTNNLEVVTDKHQKTACWDSGMAIMEQNDSKGIKHMVEPFNCYEDIIPLIKELLRKNRVLVVSANRLPRVLSHRRRKK